MPGLGIFLECRLVWAIPWLPIDLAILGHLSSLSTEHRTSSYASASLLSEPLLFSFSPFGPPLICQNESALEKNADDPGIVVIVRFARR